MTAVYRVLIICQRNCQVCGLEEAVEFCKYLNNDHLFCKLLKFNIKGEKYLNKGKIILSKKTGFKINVEQGS